MINTNILKRLSVFAVAIAIFFCSVSMSFASTLTLTPKSAIIPQGSIVSVQVKLNTTGESINGVSSYLSYPQDKLEVASITYGASAFDVAAESSFGGGAIKISRGSINGVKSASATVATINFRGKSQGIGTVSFIPGSAAARTSDSSDSLNLGGSASGTYTVGAPALKDPQLQGELAVKDVLVSFISTNSATITWTTDKDSDSTVEYGLSADKYILEVYDKTPVKTHKIVIQANLIPGETFHFRVKSKDAASEGVSQNMTFQLKGYSVRITVVDSKGNPVKDTEVTLYSTPVRQITGEDGVATFMDITPARHLVVVKTIDIEKSEEIDVTENGISEFTITLNPAAVGNNNTVLAIFYASVAIIIVIIVGVIIVRKKSSSDTYVPPMGQSL